MPFGLRGAPATFQRLMDKLLRGTESFTGVYLDDILIYSQTWQEYLSHVRVVLKRLEQAGLTLKSSKCVFGTVECEYLGHKIGKGGVSPLESKILAIQNIAKPQTKKEVRTFLGMTGYYCCLETMLLLLLHSLTWQKRISLTGSSGLLKLNQLWTLTRMPSLPLCYEKPGSSWHIHSSN